MLPPAPKQPRRPAVTRTSTFIYDSLPKQSRTQEIDNYEMFNGESLANEELSNEENEYENSNVQVLLDDLSPFVYQSTDTSTNERSANDSQKIPTENFSSPFALTMSYHHMHTVTPQTYANLTNSNDGVNCSPFVYHPTGTSPTKISHKKTCSKSSQISQLIDSQNRSLSSPFIYVESQDEKQTHGEHFKHSGDKWRKIEEITTQTDSSEICSNSPNINSSPFIYSTGQSPFVNQSQRNQINHKNELADNLSKLENSQPSQKSALKLSSQPSQSDLEFTCSPDLFATQHK